MFQKGSGVRREQICIVGKLQNSLFNNPIVRNIPEDTGLGRRRERRIRHTVALLNPEFSH